MQSQPWLEIAPNSNFFLHEYQAKNYARTNCCAIGTSEGFLILSPASGIKEEHLLFLENKAPIKALLPPHPGHTLGVNEWLRLRPKLEVYAAPKAIPRLEKVCKVPVYPIAKLPHQDPKVLITLAPGMGDTTLFVQSFHGDQPVVYVDEVLEDLDRYPGPPLLKPLMRLFGKKPGFQVNRMFLRFFVKDKRALVAEVQKLIAQDPHTVFAHGPVRSGREDLELVRRLLATI